MRDMRYDRKDEDYKDRSQLREGDSAFAQHKATKAWVKDYSLKQRVSVEWDMNQDSINDRMCILRVGNNSAVIDKEELYRAMRFL
jgi:hypothetical protein